MISLKKKLLMAVRAAVGQAVYAGSGSRKWRCPPGVKSVCVVCVGKGANSNNLQSGGGGGLAWRNNIPVTPGLEYDVVINNSESYFISSATVSGKAGSTTNGGSFVGDGGGNGGLGFRVGTDRAGGGGAGGYAGNGGAGAERTGAGSPGAGGAGAGGTSSTPDNFSGGGGGVGLLGQGVSGASAGQPGSGGGAGNSTAGGDFGGGAPKDSGDGSRSAGGRGGIRIIWGDGRAFPATNTGDR